MPQTSLSQKVLGRKILFESQRKTISVHKR